MTSKFVKSLPNRLRELADLIEQEPPGIYDADGNIKAAGNINQRNDALGFYLTTFIVRLPFSNKEAAEKAFELVVNKPPFYV